MLTWGNLNASSWASFLWSNIVKSVSHSFSQFSSLLSLCSAARSNLITPFIMQSPPNSLGTKSLFTCRAFCLVYTERSTKGLFWVKSCTNLMTPTKSYKLIWEQSMEDYALSVLWVCIMSLKFVSFRPKGEYKALSMEIP